MLFSSLKFAVLLFLLFVISDVTWEAGVILFSGSAESIFPRVAAYLSEEMHWASKIVGALFAGFLIGYLVLSDDVRGSDK